MKNLNAIKSLLIIFFTLSAITLLADSDKARQDFFEYISNFSYGMAAEDHYQPGIDFTHPYTAQAILPEVFKEISVKVLPNNLLKSSLAKSVFIENVLDSHTMSSIPDILKAYQYSIGSLEELEILKLLFTRLSRDRSTTPTAIIKILNLLKMRKKNLSYTEFPKSVAPSVISGEKFQAFAMRKRWNENLTREFKTYIIKFGLEEMALLSAAKTLTFLNKKVEAKSLIARAILLAPNLEKVVKQDSILNTIFPAGKIPAPLLPEAEIRDYSGLDKIDLRYAFTSKGVTKNENRTLIWNEGSFLERKSKIRIPSWLITQLIAEFNRSEPIKTTFNHVVSASSKHQVYLRIERNQMQSPIYIFSESKNSTLLPVFFYENGKLSKSKIKSAGRLLQLLASWLGIRMIDKAPPLLEISKWSAASENQLYEKQFSLFPELPSLKFKASNLHRDYHKRFQSEMAQFPTWQIAESNKYRSMDETEKILLIAQFVRNSKINTSKKIQAISYALFEEDKETKWLNGTAKDFFSTIETIEYSLYEAFGFENSNIVATPFHGDVDQDFYPGLSGTYHLCQFLTENALTLVETGKFNSLLKTRIENKRNNSKVETVFLPGIQNHVLTKLSLKRNSIFCSIGNQLLAQLFVPGNLLRELSIINYEPDKISLIFPNTTEKADLQTYLSTLGMNQLSSEFIETPARYEIRINMSEKSLLIEQKSQLIIQDIKGLR